MIYFFSKRNGMCLHKQFRMNALMKQAKDGFKIPTRINQRSSKEVSIYLLGVQIISSSISFYLVSISFDEWFFRIGGLAFLCFQTLEN